MFITFEGPEGGGKSSIVKRLVAWLREGGYKVAVTKEPGGTPLGVSIRSLLLDLKNVEIVPLAELLLFYVDRAQHLASVIIPALERGELVICDRFDDSSLAYQVFGRGLKRETLSVLFAIVGGVRPDLTILLDVSPDIGLNRRRADGEINRLDEEELTFHRRVRDGYLQLASEDPSRWVVIDAGRELQEVWGDVLKVVLTRLGEM